jgi:hypothetical protein
MQLAELDTPRVTARPKTFPWGKPCAYDEAHKHAFHREAAKRLRRLAKIMNFDRNNFELRANKAGIPVSGEITLHHEHVYLQVAQSCMGPASGIMFRTCNGRKDFTGGPNHFAPLCLLDDLPELARRIAKLLPTTTAPAI